jgi:TolB-like protein
VSEAVHKNLLNKKGIESTFIREEQLKNVREPVRIYQVKVEGVEPMVVNAEPSTATPLESPKSTAQRKVAFVVVGVIAILLLSYFLFINQSPDQVIDESQLDITDKSIAVLPFVNMSNDPDQEYFSDGMMEAILNHLTKIEGLRITSRTTMMTYKGSDKKVPEIANEVGARYVLEGSVQKSETTVRITAQLIDAQSDEHMWSETYDREFVEIFAIQSEVAQQVALALKTQLQPEIIQRMDQIPTENMEAYDLYLRAGGFIGAFNLDYNDRREWLLQAIKLDSNFSAAYAVLGNAIIFEAGITGDKNTSDVAEEGKATLEKALLLNPLDGIAHTAMSQYYLWYEKDFSKAEIYIRAAQKLSPSDQRPLSTYTELLLAAGRFQEAILMGTALLEVAGDQPGSWGRMSLVWAFNNDLENTEKAVERAIKQTKLSPLNPVSPYTESARAYLVQKQYAQIPKVLGLSFEARNIPRGMCLLAIAHEKLGETVISNQFLESLIQRSKETAGGSPSFYTAMVYASMDEIEKAFTWLGKSMENNEIELYWLKVEPEFASLHDDLRWQQMLDKVGFLD